MIHKKPAQNPEPITKEDALFSELATLVENFPRQPGVYLMRDTKEVVIYVGKAIDLRARVRTYFHPDKTGDGRYQLPTLLSKVTTVEKIVTANENQAFILERDLIQKYKPRYNIKLKDDKNYLHIRIDLNADWPRLELVRKTEEDDARYFGPYSFGYELRQLLDLIKRTIPLRTCSNTIFYNRQRPCLEYQIKRCSGPCCLKVDPVQYKIWVKQAISLLEGKVDKLKSDLEGEMLKLSNDLRFEEAAAIRDRIESLNKLQETAVLTSASNLDRDMIGLYQDRGMTTLSILRMRGGRIVENKNFDWNDTDLPPEEIIESALTQYYSSQITLPEEILVPIQLTNAEMLIQAWQTQKDSRKKLKIIVPQRGLKNELLELAQTNAREHFHSTFDAEVLTQQSMKKLALLLSLKQIPRRIECVDISNLQSSNIVGAIVSFFDGEPDKSRYRKYKLEFRTPNDFEAIYQVVKRRLEHGKVEQDLPDLLIIDGGPPQFAKALQARDELGVDLEIVALAKTRLLDETGGKYFDSAQNVTPERIYLEGKEIPVVLDLSDPVTHLVQRIRDEAHRFVITFHRTKRAQRVLFSALDQVSGVGAERKKRLLKHFGSVAMIKLENAESVAKVGRMPIGLAQKILERLKSNLHNKDN